MSIFPLRSLWLNLFGRRLTQIDTDKIPKRRLFPIFFSYVTPHPALSPPKAEVGKGAISLKLLSASICENLRPN